MNVITWASLLGLLAGLRFVAAVAAAGRLFALFALVRRQYISFEFPQIDFLLRNGPLDAILVHLKQRLARLLLLASQKSFREPIVEAVVVRSLQLVAVLADAVHRRKQATD